LKPQAPIRFEKSRPFKAGVFVGCRGSQDPQQLVFMTAKGENHFSM
jgi:hypothetical protein